jgi:hypothetical protein
MTMPERRDDTEREQADGEAVLRHAFHGEPLDPEVARRVRERGAEITEEIYREHGEIDPETIHAREIGALVIVVCETRESEVRRNRPAAVLLGNNVVELSMGIRRPSWAFS